MEAPIDYSKQAQIKSLLYFVEAACFLLKFYAKDTGIT